MAYRGANYNQYQSNASNVRSKSNGVRSLQRYSWKSTDQQFRPYGKRIYHRHRSPRLYSDRLQNRMNFWGFNTPPAPQKPAQTNVWSVLRHIISAMRFIVNIVFKFLQAKFPEQFAGGGFCSPGCCCGAVAATATVVVVSVGLGVGLGVGLTSGDPPFNATRVNGSITKFLYKQFYWQKNY